MEFRTRDYEAEVRAFTLPRNPTDGHPLAPSSGLRSSQVRNFDQGKSDVCDPLRSGHNEHLVPVENLAYIPLPSISETSSLSTTELLEKEWSTFKKFMLQKFPSTKTVSVSSISAVVVKSAKVHEKSSVVPLNELDDQQKLDDLEGIMSISQQEYVAKLNELKSQIVHAWNVDDRVTSLKLSIKVARLLMDTRVSQFYPTLFSLATEILDMLGDMVWKRIKQKAEFSEDGMRICTLPENFDASEICSEAKDTCYNWFCKIGSIRELLPRIYLELALFPCWRFLLDQPDKALHRLVMMTRGLAHPLASAYCHMYIAYSGKKLQTHDRGYLITCMNEINNSLLPIIAHKDLTNGISSKGKDIIICLIEPTIEFIMKCIFHDPKRQVNYILAELGVKEGQSYVSTKGCISIILHHLLKELPVELINANAVDILELIECSNDLSFLQCNNFRLFGFRLSEQTCSTHLATEIVEKIIEVINPYNLDEYVKVIDAFIDILLHNQMRNHLQIILGGMAIRACSKWTSESELEGLQSILVKIVTNLNLEAALQLEHFTEILNVLRGRSRAIVNALILNNAIRNSYISEPNFIQFLFEVARGMHERAHSSNLTNDGDQQFTKLILRFVQTVDYGMDLERHLAFLVDCRGAFAEVDELKVSLVHMCNNLAVKGFIQGIKSSSFIRSCLAFSEVTIPSIYGHMKQLHLYLETTEVALICNLIGHSDGFVDSALSCLQSLVPVNDARASVSADEVVAVIKKLCNLILLIPGNPKHGSIHILNSLLTFVNSQSWITISMKTRTLCGFAVSLAALSQNKYLNHAASKEVLSNDLLYFGDASYQEELKSVSGYILDSMCGIIQQEHSKAVGGMLALEACNCIALSFKMNNEAEAICTKLVEIAESCLSASDPFLRSTTNFMHKMMLVNEN